MLKSGPFCAFALLATAGMSAAGCGGGTHFKNHPRAPAPVQLTGVIRDNRLTVSPNRVGAGPIILLVSNQTQDAHTVVVSGGGGDEDTIVGPVNPLDVAKIQQDFKEGTYTVKAGSKAAVAHQPKPATLHVGPPRRDSSDQVMLP